MITRRNFIKMSSALSLMPIIPTNGYSFQESSTTSNNTVRHLPHATSSKLPRWRGFNLLEKFNGSNQPFREDDFRNISDLGFNFVRLPMDYRCWILDGNKRKFNEKTLSEIDKAVEYGKKYGIHVHINFHRAPGYTVANPPEKPLVWHDEETLDICKLHWQTFAKRYRDVPEDLLSFNLFNEPAGCTETEYFKVAQTLVETIRKENPKRVISCDGIDYGTKPCRSFKDLNVAQSTRGYAPMEISHYGASWVNSKDFPYPRWPSTSFNGLLPSPHKNELSQEIRKPLSIEGRFPNNSTLRFKIGTVSVKAEIVVIIDNKEIFRRQYIPKSGHGEWKEVNYNERYGVYQNHYDLNVELKIPNNSQSISIANVDGDWATITEIEIFSEKGSAFSTGIPEWNAQLSTSLKYQDEKDKAVLLGSTTRDRQWLWETYVEPWKDAERQGIGVMVGEFGAYNATPHPVVLHWLEDMLINWQKANWGWALWNFRGSFGIADSDRRDVKYEDWRGLKLDRKMLDLLQKY